MTRRSTWALGAVAALACSALALTPSGGTDAQWRESASRTVTGPTADSLEMTATDRGGAVPQIDLTSTSSRQTSWVNVKSSRVDRVVAEGGTAPIAGMALGYTFGAGSCQSGGQGGYWAARSAGQVTPRATYTRTESKVAGATLAPGATRSLCPAISFSTSSTQTLLNHAGRAFDITTLVNQRSEAPATWASTDRTVTSRYRVAMPAPETPSASHACQRTLSNGTPSALGYYGGFFWGWPDAATASETTTPAMAGGWEILRKTRAGGWEVWKTVASGNLRALAGINSKDISDVREEVREFKIRGYPFAADRSRYVESAWIARAHNDWSLLTDRWACDSPIPNLSAGPTNMP